MNRRDRRIITITGENNKSEKVEVIVHFVFKDTQREFLVYTKNETKEDRVIVYVSRVERYGGTPILTDLTEEDDKRVMRALREMIELNKYGFRKENIDHED